MVSCILCKMEDLLFFFILGISSAKMSAQTHRKGRTRRGKIEK